MRTLLISLALVAGTPAVAEPGVKMFGGWIAGCSNENICTAIHPAWDVVDGLPADPGSPLLQIRHHPHRDATPEITLIDQKNPSPDAVLKPPLAVMAVEFEKSEADCKCKSDRPRNIIIYHADIDGKGGYRFNDEDARSVLYGLRRGKEVLVTIGDKYALPIDTRHLDEALAHFDREQDLDHTPGALVLRPNNIMYDYVHPTPPEADPVQLSTFNGEQLHNWLVEYPERTPDEIIDVEPMPDRGLVIMIRAKSLEGDCGIFERWGHIGSGNDFALAERREMPVCSGIGERHWIQTYRADTISPEAK